MNWRPSSPSCVGVDGANEGEDEVVEANECEAEVIEADEGEAGTNKGEVEG